MTYGNCYFHLQATLAREERAKLAARIRRNRYIVAVTVGERQVHIWYKRQMPFYQLQQLQQICGDMQLPEAPAEESAAAEDAVDIDETVRSIEEQVSRPSAPEPALDLDLSDFDLSAAPKRRNLSSTQSFNI